MSRFGLIAGNGRFPVLALEAAQANGDEVVCLAIKEEASSDVEALAAKTYWISLGDLSKLIDICHQEKISEVMMCGQVKHAKIFSAIRPDWRLVKLLMSLTTKNTGSLIGGVAKVLSDEGIKLVASTKLLTGMLADEGVMTKRAPNGEEKSDIEYGRQVANTLSGFDVGQSVAIASGACVAVEAMEGTDAMLRRAASLVNGKPLRLVKAGRGRQHQLWDVPVVGLDTIAVMRECRATALSVDAGRTLLLDKAKMIDAANAAGITMIGEKAEGA